MRILAAILCAWFTGTAHVSACSVGPDYVRPSNFELIQMSDAIVVARPTGNEKQIKTSSGYEYSLAEFATETVIKGNQLPTKLALAFELGETLKSDPNELLNPHPEAMAGGCNRYFVSEGKNYVILLRKDKENGEWRANSWFPFTRVVEDFYGEESLWLKAIRFYLDVQQDHTPLEQLHILQQRYQHIATDEKASEHDRILALDIAEHLMSRSPFKPTSYLVNSYQALQKGTNLPFSVRGPEANKENSEAQKLTELVLASGSPIEFNRDAQMESILWSLANGKHPTAKNFMTALLAANDPTPATVGAVVKYLANHDYFVSAAEVVRDRGLVIAATKPLPEVSQFFRGALSIAFNHEDHDKPLWLTEPTVARWWPEYYFAMVNIINQRYGSNNWGIPSPILEAIRPTDYRDNPQVTLALVREYDEHVVNWAKTEVFQLLKAKTEAYKQDYALPVGVLLEDYRPDNTETIEKLFCDSKVSRYLLLKFIGSHQDIYTEELLSRMALSDDLNEEEKDALLQSLTIFAGNNRSAYVQHDRGWGINSEFDLLIQLASGNNNEIDSDLKPIDCS